MPSIFLSHILWLQLECFGPDIARPITFFRFIQNLARNIWLTILQCYGSDQKNTTKKSAFPIESSLRAFHNCLNLWMNSTKVIEAICYSNPNSDRNSTRKHTKYSSADYYQNSHHKNSCHWNSSRILKRSDQNSDCWRPPWTQNYVASVTNKQTNKQTNRIQIGKSDGFAF